MKYFYCTHACCNTFVPTLVGRITENSFKPTESFNCSLIKDERKWIFRMKDVSLHTRQNILLMKNQIKNVHMNTIKRLINFSIKTHYVPMYQSDILIDRKHCYFQCFNNNKNWEHNSINIDFSYV